ncbi:MAG TPA: CDP-glucose 4,6-dehydratase [Bryobacteraceae bacterium]|nr:CDP-glucose 4,6-dehydratase [Bryobacteraceae bacterium]
MPGIEPSFQLRLRGAYAGKRVLLTGHTGFKGAWLSEWLLSLGAEVTGVALPPATTPSLFDEIGLEARMDHRIQDIRDAASLRAIVASVDPDFVFHLAAQPLVRLSYEQSVETYATNVMGTVHLLEALRVLGGRTTPCATVFVTTDKCYANREWNHAYRETDALGGHDPYSASKAAAEIAIASFRSSFFNPAASRVTVGIASARAGNVIGGGDWALDRIVPDAMKALEKGQPVVVRNPDSTRPWQHVLEPLSGYLVLAMQQREALIAKDRPRIEALCAAFNFGPPVASNRTVGALVDEILHHWPGPRETHQDPDARHEAGKLNLAWEKAFHLLGWHPRWDFAHTVGRTVGWYRRRAERTATQLDLMHQDITSYMSGGDDSAI